ncbi:VIT domain-containing protein [Actinoplanes sp. CA-051413]|uniref:VIT domain-containing protein n=1 Tax=Actinoplanes sp. CA-051413 TaxID=3239899 RepID=UPI003D99041D
MTLSVKPMDPAELGRVRILPDAGLGALLTERGNLPLDRLDVQAAISGLVARTTVTAEYVNAHDTPLEATYVFPLPDRAAVTGMTMTADGRTVEAELQERAQARQNYDQAIAAGQRASIAEEERPDVFTMRVGNILPGERVTIALSLVGPLPWEDGAATFRFPLVVAPRYVPGAPLPGPAVGSGQAQDTDAVPDASRITPPVLLPGFPNPLRLSIGVDIDPAGLGLGEVRSSLHTVTGEGGRVEIAPGERADRDFILRLPYAGDGSGAVCVSDPTADGPEGTYQVVLVPPDDAATAGRPKDVVLLLDRSGSMGGWKMVAARRAAARVVDTLTTADRFAVLTFDHQVDRPDALGTGLSEATDRNRFRAVEHLSRADARGGTEMLVPLREGLSLLADSGSRERVLVLVTDGQVGNEDQILAEITGLIGTTRVHTVGIDRAVNVGFLGRLAALGAGRCELVESEDRLDEAMAQIHRRIAAPVLTDVTVTATDFSVEPAPAQTVFPGVPLVVFGRYTGTADGTLTVRGRTRDDEEFVRQIPVRDSAEPAVTAQWARARLRELEDRYLTGQRELEQTIVATSLRYGVLCRFTAYVAVDSRVVTEGGEVRRVTQPVESPSGWDMFDAPAAGGIVLASMSAPVPPPAAGPRIGGFAPARASSMRSGPKPFAQMPAGLQTAGRSGKMAAPGSSPLTLADLTAIVAIEATRLREAEGRSALERRDLLADLASRLGALLEGRDDAELKGLRDLVDRLKADGGLPAKWALARETLESFAPPPQRKAFWKR